MCVALDWSIRMSDSSVPSQGSSYNCTVSPSVVVTEVVDPSGRLNMLAVKSAGFIPSTVIEPVSAEWVTTVPVRPSVRAVKVRSANEISSGSMLRSIVSLSLSKSWIVSSPELAANTNVSSPVPPVSESSPRPPTRVSSPSSPYRVSLPVPPTIRSLPVPP